MNDELINEIEELEDRVAPSFWVYETVWPF